MLSFYPQERPESCVPACLRMVLESAGYSAPEAAFYQGCETDIDGTLPSKAAQYAVSLGFDALSTRLPTIHELIGYMESNAPYPIVFVNLSSILGINVIHAVVVESIDYVAETITVVDPAFPPTGRRKWALDLFAIAWEMARYQTILVISAL